MLNDFLLLKEKPCAVVNGVKYALDLSFQKVMRAILALDDKVLSSVDKIIVVFNLLVEDAASYECTINEANDVVLEILKILNGNSDIKIRSEDEEPQPVYFDWVEDAERLYASFKMCYDIDIIDADLSWKKFNALFNNLDKDTPLMEAIKYRAMDIPDSDNKEYREHVINMKKHYRLEANEYYEEYQRAKRMYGLMQSLGYMED